MKRQSLAALLSAVLLGAGLAVTPRSAMAAPEPSQTPVSWQLGFRYGPMERIFITADGKQQTYWFMRYTVTNNAGRDILFTPGFQLVADTGTVQDAFKEANGKDAIPGTVFDAIHKLYNSPLLQNPNAIYGKLLQGEDNAKDGVVIFPALDPDARQFQLFVTGLSGETAEVKNPVTGKPVILQKTLELDFTIPGQAVGIEPKTQFTAVKWVMK